MTRWYVTMTWDDWPEGGSYGTIVEAPNPDHAQWLTHMEMAQSRCDEWRPEPEYWLDAYQDEWHVVDCFDLDAFIQDQQRGLSHA